MAPAQNDTPGVTGPQVRYKIGVYKRRVRARPDLDAFSPSPPAARYTSHRTLRSLPVPCPCALTVDPLAPGGMAEVPGLAEHLEPLDIPAPWATRYFRCRTCGERWQEQLESFMHAHILVLVRTQLDQHGQPRRLRFDPSLHGLKILSGE